MARSDNFVAISAMTACAALVAIIMGGIALGNSYSSSTTTPTPPATLPESCLFFIAEYQIQTQPSDLYQATLNEFSDVFNPTCSFMAGFNNLTLLKTGFYEGTLELTVFKAPANTGSHRGTFLFVPYPFIPGWSGSPATVHTYVPADSVNNEQTNVNTVSFRFSYDGTVPVLLPTLIESRLGGSGNTEHNKLSVFVSITKIQ